MHYHVFGILRVLHIGEEVNVFLISQNTIFTYQVKGGVTPKVRTGSESTSSTLFQCLLRNEATKGPFSPAHLDLPVGLSCDINIVQVSGVVLRVRPAQNQLSTHCCFRVSERKGGQKNKSLL